MTHFRVATYNIHKGFSHLNRHMVIHELRERLHGLRADIVFLQEVVGANSRHADRYLNWPVKPQHEFLADSMWSEIAYGKNAIYEHGHHGNAVLTRYPIASIDNEDISAHAFESRGLLHCELNLPGATEMLHCINVHLGLLERGRQWQLLALCERIEALVPANAPLIIAGDFNDWRHKANRMLIQRLGVHEVFETVKGRPARSFPSVLPVFRLDRIYARGLKARGVGVHYANHRSRLSDHAALTADFELA